MFTVLSSVSSLQLCALGRRRRSGMHITPRPQVFLLIFSSAVALSGEQLNSGDMSVIVWSVFKCVSGNTVHDVHLEARCGFVWDGYNDASQCAVCFLTRIHWNHQTSLKQTWPSLVIMRIILIAC